MIKDLYLKLEEDDLRALLRGGEVTLTLAKADTRVHFILSDIGFDLIQEALDDAQSGHDTYKGSARELP